MSVACLQFSSGDGGGNVPDPMARIRAVAGVNAQFAHEAGNTRIATLSEYGGYRAKFPVSADRGIEAVLVNTGGGVAGGDTLAIDINAGAETAVTVSTPSAERIYRSTAAGHAADIDVKLTVGAGATLVWAPQATILFNGARLNRRLTVEASARSCLLMAEITIFGRTASGETLIDGAFSDQWRVKRDGQLVFADATKLAGAITTALSRSAVAGGAAGVGLLVAMAPAVKDRLDEVRAALADQADLVGASAWDGVLVVRCLGSSLDRLHMIMGHVMQVLAFRPLPASWRSPFVITPSSSAIGLNHRGAP